MNHHHHHLYPLMVCAVWVSGGCGFWKLTHVYAVLIRLAWYCWVVVRCLDGLAPEVAG
jgi:hypothetical protein